MKRPLILFAAALICGIVIAKVFHSIILILFIMALIAVFTATINSKFRPRAYLMVGVLLFFSAGAFRYVHYDILIKDRYEKFFDKQVVIEGYVCSEPDVRENCVMYVVKTEYMSFEKEGYKTDKKGKVLLITLKTENDSMYEYGRGLRIWGQLKRPRGSRNPGGFDYRQYLAQSGISGTIFASEENVKVMKDLKDNVLIKTGIFLRKRIIDVVYKSVPKQQAGLLTGMMIGYRQGLSEEVEEAFSDSGLMHIMAVSGSNIAFIVFPLLFGLKKIKMNNKAANTIVMAILVLFVMITGFEASVLRAVIMAETALLGKIINRDTEVVNSISFAAILMLLYNPYTLFNIGFQLSFTATISLVLLYSNIKDKINFKLIPDFVKDVFAGTMSAQLGVLPLSIYYFNKVSIISLLSNLIVLPLTGVITILGFIMVILGALSIEISSIVGCINCTLLSFVLIIVKITSNFPFAVVRLLTPPLPLVLLCYVLIFFFLWYKPAREIKLDPKYYIVFFAILGAMCCMSFFVPKNMEVIFLDVGQGDSIFIRTSGGKTVLIDGGTGDIEIIPFLLDYGVFKLDMVMATHGHDDHIGGLTEVLKNFKVKNFIMPFHPNPKEFKNILNIVQDREISTFMVQMGDEITLDEKTFFYVLNPHRGLYQSDVSLNNSSLVLKLRYKNVNLLLTGDAEQEVENLLLEMKCDIRADVLKIGHHGSDSSTIPAFLDEVNPLAAVISVGENNKFGHPSPVVLNRLKNRGIHVYRTDRDGAVILKTNGNSIKMQRHVNDDKDWWINEFRDFKQAN